MSVPGSGPLVVGMASDTVELPATVAAFTSSGQFATGSGDDCFFAFVQQMQNQSGATGSEQGVPTGSLVIGVHPGPSQANSLSVAALTSGPLVPQLEGPSFDLDKFLVQGLGQHDEVTEKGETSTPSTTPSGGTPGRKSKQRTRTEKQQELNKQAQQRYRERRKARLQEMERQVEELNEQIESLQKVESDKNILSRRNVYLEKLVRIQGEKIQNLKKEVAQQASELAQLGEPRPARESCSVPIDAGSLREQLRKDVESLETVLKSNGADSGPAPETMQGHTFQYFRQRVTHICDMHVRLLAVEAPEVSSMMSRESEAKKRARQSNNRIEECIQRLGLTQDQEDTILRMRADHLSSMRQIFQDRTGLNLKAMGLMLPHPLVEKNGPYDATIDGKLSCHSSNGYMYCREGDDQLIAILKEIKENLQKEQQSFMEMVVNLLCNILDPVQAALALVNFYPDVVDALALANAVARAHGQVCGNLESQTSGESHVDSKIRRKE